MKLSEIKQSVTVALMTSIASESEEKSSALLQEVSKQCDVVGKYLGEQFMKECMAEAQQCLEDPKRFDQSMEKFKDVGPRFSTEIEEE
jgi:hypothetical protein